MQVRTTVRCHFTPEGGCFKANNRKNGCYYGETEHRALLTGMVQLLRKMWLFLKNINMEPLQDPVILLWLSQPKN